MSWISSRVGNTNSGTTTTGNGISQTQAPSTWLRKRYQGIVDTGLNNQQPIQQPTPEPVITPQQPIQQQKKPGLLNQIKQKVGEYRTNIQDNMKAFGEFINKPEATQKQEYQIGNDTVQYTQIADSTNKAVGQIDTRISEIENEIINRYYDNQKKIRIGIPIIGGDVGTPFDTPESMKLDKDSIRRILASNDYMTGDTAEKNKLIKVNKDIENKTKDLAKERANLIATRQLYNEILSHDKSDTTFWEGIKDGVADPVELTPFLGSINKLGDFIEIYKVQNKKANNIPLTKYEESILKKEEAKAFENIVNEKGLGYTLGSILVQMPTYSVEFLATGGINSAVSTAVSKTPAVATVASKSPIAGKLIAGLAGVTAQTTLGFSQSYLAKAMEYAVDDGKEYDFDEGLAVDYAGSKEDLEKALLDNLPKAYAYQWMEIAGERSGEGLTYLQKGLLAKYFKKTGVKSLTEAQKVLQKAGWNGVINEIVEEEITYAGQSLVEGTEYKAPGLSAEANQRLLLEVLSIGIYGSLLKTGEVVANKNESAKAEKILKEEAKKQGISDEDVNNFINELKQAGETKSETNEETKTEGKPKQEEAKQLKQLTTGTESVTLYRGLNEDRGKSNIPYEEGVTFYTTDKATAEDYADFQTDDRIKDLEKKKKSLESSVDVKLGKEKISQIQEEILSINDQIEEIQREVNKNPELKQIKQSQGRMEEIKNPLKNPLVVNAGGQTFDKVTEDAIKKAKENGNDGVVINNVVDAIDRKNAKPITTVIVFNKETTNKTEEAIKKTGESKVDSRPSHQKEIENLINQGKMAEARAKAESLDDTDPYKKSMLNMIKMLEGEESGQEAKAGEQVRSGVIRPGDIGIEKKDTLGDHLTDKYGKDVKKATKNEILLASDDIEKFTDGIEYTPDIAKKYGKTTVSISEMEDRPALIYGGLRNGVYTDGYTLVLDQELAKEINTNMIDKVKTKRVKELLKTNIPFKEATDIVTKETEDKIKEFTDKYPEWEQIVPDSLADYTVELKPKAIYQKYLVLSGENNAVGVNPDYYQYLMNNLEIDKVVSKDNVTRQPILFLDKNDDIKAILMPVVITEEAVDKFKELKKGEKKSEVSEKEPEVKPKEEIKKPEKKQTESKSESAEELLKRQIGDTFEKVKPVGNIWQSKGNVIFIRPIKARIGYASWLESRNFIDKVDEAGGNNVYRVVVKLDTEVKEPKKSINKGKHVLPKAPEDIPFDRVEPKKKSVNKKKPSTSKAKADKGGEYADLGQYAKEIKKKFGESYTKIKALEMPELVQFIKDITGGKTPLVKKIRGDARGMFRPATMDIVIQPDLFKDTSIANKVLAHELGHLVDYLPDKDMKRGNILGRIATLRGYRKSLLAEYKNSENVVLTKEDRDRLRKEARKLVKEEIEITEEIVVSEAPLDPKDILDIWNDTTAGIKNPELLQYISELSTEEKKAIIKQAMKGTVPAWVNFKKQIKETITRKVIKNSPADVRNAYKKLVREEIIKRRLFQEEVIRNELKDLSQYWKPFDRSIDPGYTAYRDSSEELYADALSVLFNDPALLKMKAPNFMKGFFNYLDEKPDVAREFTALQDILNAGEDVLLQRRNDMLNDMYQRAEDKYLAKEIEKTQRKNSLWTDIRILFDTRNARIYKDVNQAKKLGRVIRDEVNPSYLLEEQQYNDAYVKNIIEKLFQGIKSKVETMPNGWVEFGKVLQLERSINERGELANPGGFDPKTAQDTLDYIKSQHTAKEWETLQKATNEFRDSMQEVINMAEKGGYYRPEMIEQMKANRTYATYQVIDYLDTYISPAVHKQVGTFKDVANPATASVMKVISTINAIERNTAKRETIDFFIENYPEEVDKAKTKWNGKYHEIIDKKVPGKELVRIIRDGKVEGYYVDPQIASALNGNSIPFIQLLSKFSRKFLLADIYRSLFTSINLGFQTYNLTRDFMDTWKKYPDKTMKDALLSFPKIVNQYRKAVKPAWSRLKGTDNDIIKEMENLKILGLNYKTMFDATDDELSQIDRTLARVGLQIKEKNETNIKNKIGKTFKNTIDALGAFGNFIESLPKVAGYMELKGTMNEKELASFVRTMVGSPNFREKGVLTPITNNIFLFSNAIKEGYKSSLRAGFVNKETRSGYWMKTFLANVLPKLIMLAMAYGLFGEKLQKMMGNVSEYDKSNYIIIPLGLDENGKTILLRVPTDETGRLIGGMVWKTLNIGNDRDIGLEDLTDLFAFYSGQIPSLNPAFTGAGAIMQYLSGRNPYDDFRSRNIISDTAFQAGFKYSAPELLDWLIRNQGLGIVIPGWKPDYMNMTTLEKVVNAPVLSNIIGRWIKVTDQGTTEQYREVINEVKQEKAIELMEENQGVQSGYDEYKSSKNYEASVTNMLNKVYGKSVDEINSSDDKELIANAKNTIKKLNTAIIRGKADPEVNALISANTNEAKAELLNVMFEDMDSKEIEKFLSELLEQDIITMDVLEKYQKLNK